MEIGEIQKQNIKKILKKLFVLFVTIIIIMTVYKYRDSKF